MNVRMGDYLANVASILEQAQFRLDAAAQNVANITTPGFRKHVAYRDAAADSSQNADAADFDAGPITQTGSSLDLAVLDDSFFVVQAPDGLRYTRAGSFRSSEDRRLVTPEGYALLLEGGAELITDASALQILEDGVVVDHGHPIGKLWTVKVTEPLQSLRRDAGGFSAADGAQIEASVAPIRQGALETSNVSSAAEMIAMMAALRQAESGQRLANVYDELTGRAFSVLGGQ